jgi:hypothetical protein
MVWTAFFKAICGNFMNKIVRYSLQIFPQRFLPAAAARVAVSKPSQAATKNLLERNQFH